MSSTDHRAGVSKYQRPPLKWAGGKYGILDRVLAELPRGERFVEPFLGSSVVFLNVEYPRYRLSDVNPDLVNFYERLKQEGESFVEACRALFEPSRNDRDSYEELRDRFNSSTDPNERAVLLLYLNRHGYNGLYRVNRSGKFNVPFGRYRKPKFPSAAMMQFHRKAQHAEISRCDFQQTLDGCKPGDVVYCDPAYVPLSPTASFTSYARGGFDMSDQQRLADSARALADRGVTVVISNHDNEITRELYAGARIIAFRVRRTISRDVRNRGLAPELLAVFGSR